MRNLDFTSTAEKQLKRLLKTNQSDTKKLIQEMEKLCETPDRGKKLKGNTDYSARVGNYRVIYNFTDDKVEITAVGHRKNIYRKHSR